MSTTTKQATKRPCATPGCDTVPRKGKFCAACRKTLDRIKQELRDDPRKLYSQRSDNPNRRNRDHIRKKPSPRTPTCCRAGCYEIRVPPDPFCGGDACLKDEA